jgi:NADPH:quinone reductase-like Zn-dependent oxidoreductase
MDPGMGKTGTATGAIPTTMRAMVQERYGAARDVLEPREVPVPDVDDHEVLLRVHSSSINALEWHLINGKPYVFRPVFGLSPRNATPGADVSGTVVEVGPAVTEFEVGDQVFGDIEAGAYAEYAKTDEQHLASKPESVGFEEAAAVGVAGLTALQGLRDVAGIEPGQSVLVNGASGGVGTYAIQVAKALGAEVTAVCSTRNVDQAHELGADQVLDYKREDVTETDQSFDIMFDIPGNHTIGDCKRLVTPGGIYVMVGGPKGDWTGPLLRLIGGKFVFAFGAEREANFTAEPRANDLATLGDWLASGRVRSVIEDIVPLADIADPLDRQGRFHARGKTVVRVEGGI